MRHKVFAREHILAGMVVAILLAAVAVWLRRGPEPAGRPPERLIVHNFGPVELATPEQRERMRRTWEGKQWPR